MTIQTFSLLLFTITYVNQEEWLTRQDFSFSDGKSCVKVISAQKTEKRRSIVYHLFFLEASEHI